MTQLEERSLDRKEQESSCGVHTEFHAKKHGRGCQLDVVRRTELFDLVNDEFLNQVGAVGDAGDEGSAGNCNSRQR